MMPLSILLWNGLRQVNSPTMKALPVEQLHPQVLLPPASKTSALIFTAPEFTEHRMEQLRGRAFAPDLGLSGFREQNPDGALQ